jgi:ABC-type transporter Mla subunit MlaD
MSAVKCEIKASLLAAYQHSTESYSKVAAELARKIRKAPKSEYDKLNRAAEQARYASMDARDYLERHTAEHGC